MLEDQVGVQLGPVVVNGVDLGVGLPAASEMSSIVGDLDAATAVTLTDAADFRRSRREMERQELARLAEELPIPQIVLPARLVAGLVAADVTDLAAGLGGLAPVETAQ